MASRALGTAVRRAPRRTTRRSARPRTPRPCPPLIPGPGSATVSTARLSTTTKATVPLVIIILTILRIIRELTVATMTVLGTRIPQRSTKTMITPATVRGLLMHLVSTIVHDNRTDLIPEAHHHTRGKIESTLRKGKAAMMEVGDVNREVPQKRNTQNILLVTVQVLDLGHIRDHLRKPKKEDNLIHHNHHDLTDLLKTPVR